MFIEPGAPVTTEDLLRGLIIQSGNDAAVALPSRWQATRANSSRA